MATTEIEAPTVHPGRLGRVWERVERPWKVIATILAIIGLIDLSEKLPGQLIRWAASVHWIATQYAAVRNWAFGWLPFHIPPEWHDPIVLFLTLLSVTNVGLYRKTGHTIVNHIVDRTLWTYIAMTTMVVAFIITIICDFSFIEFMFPGKPSWYYFGYDMVIALYFSSVVLPVILTVFFVTAMFIAWRWVLTVAAFFGALVVINQAYVLWLEPPPLPL